MDDATRQSTAGGPNRPQLSFPLYLAAALAALAWPRLAPDAGLFARLGPDATAILWVPFALWAAAEGVLLVAPHIRALSAGDARRLAVARLVSGIRLLARCSVWLIPLVMHPGGRSTRLGGSADELAAQPRTGGGRHRHLPRGDPAGGAHQSGGDRGSL